jgi:hypothetical protein
MICPTTTVTFGHWVFEVWLHQGECYAKNEDHDPITKKRQAVVVKRTGASEWAGPAGQVANVDLIDKLERGYRHLMGW